MCSALVVSIIVKILQSETHTCWRQGTIIEELLDWFRLDGTPIHEDMPTSSIYRSLALIVVNALQFETASHV